VRSIFEIEFSEIEFSDFGASLLTSVSWPITLTPVKGILLFHAAVAFLGI